MNSPADAQVANSDRVRVVTGDSHGGVTDDQGFEDLEKFLDAMEVVKVRVKREAPHEYAGVLRSFVIDPRGGGLEAFFDEVAGYSGGGYYSMQQVGAPKTGGFGRKWNFRIGGLPFHPRRENPALGAMPTAVGPSYVPPVHIERREPPQMYDIVRDLLQRHTSGGISKEDLASALQTALQHHAPQPVKQGLGEVAESIQQYKALKELFAGEDSPEPLRGADGAPGWIQAAVAFAPHLPGVIGGLRSLLMPPAPPWAQQYGSPPGHPAPQMSGVPGVPGWQTPTPAAPRPNPADGPQNPQGQSAPPPAAESAKVPEGYSESDQEDGAEEEEEAEGDLLSPEEIVAEFKHATKEEQIKILAGQLAYIDPSINEELVRSMISQREAEADPTATSAKG